MVRRKFSQYFLYPFLAIMIAMLIGAFIIWRGGNNPIEVYRLMIEGSVGTSQTLSGFDELIHLMRSDAIE